MRWIWVIATLVACGKSDAPQGAAGSGSGSGSAAAGSGSAVVVAAGSGSSAGSAASAGSAGSAAGSAATAAATPPLSPKIKAARCGEPCLFLVDTTFDKLVETYSKECAGMKTPDLGYTDCKTLDYARNCIYAAHGIVFKKKKWKLFEKKPWYEANPALDVKTVLTPFELTNVHELNSRGKACKKGLAISGADYDRVKAWFAKLPAGGPLPKLVFEDETSDAGDDLKAVSGKDFFKFLNEKQPKAKSRLGHDKAVTAFYVEAGEKLLEAVNAPDAKKLRMIHIDFENAHGTDEEPFSEGTTVKIVYDDKDVMQAIEVASYMLD